MIIACFCGMLGIIWFWTGLVRYLGFGLIWFACGWVVCGCVIDLVC